MIFDCFTFNNELDLLEIRLTVLDGVVDRFVLCEAPFTFRGTPKPLYFAENADRFARWKDRILHLVYSVEPNSNPWLNEYGQRAYLAHALHDAHPDDLVLLGDVDEIPHPKNVARLPKPGCILVHRQRFAVGYFNRVIGDDGWHGTRAIRRRDIPAFGTLHDVRISAAEESDIVTGGWHFSSLGGSQVLKEKMHTYSHAELDVPYYTDRLRLEAEFTSSEFGLWRPLEDDAPEALRDPRWARYFWEQPPPDDGTGEVQAHAHGCFAYVDERATRIAAVTADDAAWSRAGKARFGSAFTGAAATVASIVPRLERGSWIVIDGFERLTARELTALHERRLHVVAYLRNARSHEAVKKVLAGEPFPPGRTIGITELRRDVAAAGLVIERYDRIAIRAIFAPLNLVPPGSFTFKCPPVTLLQTTVEPLEAFLSLAHVAVLAPAPGEPT